MGLRLFLSVVFVSFLAGCATTQQPTALNQLQIKVAQLERKVEDRDQEISDLKDEIQNMSSDAKRSSSAESEPMVIPLDKASDSVDVVSDSPGSTKDDGAIRVNATAVQVQKALKNAGYYNGAVDGKIGPNTQKAIEKFQKDHNLKSDGVIGKRTWQELKTYLQ